MRTSLVLVVLLVAWTSARADEALLQVGGALPKPGALKLADLEGTDRGPLRLVVLTDKEPSRSVHALRKLEVLDLRSAH